MTSNKYESVYDQKEFMITFTMIFACNEVKIVMTYKRVVYMTQSDINLLLRS